MFDSDTTAFLEAPAGFVVVDLVFASMSVDFLQATPERRRRRMRRVADTWRVILRQKGKLPHGRLPPIQVCPVPGQGRLR